MKSQVTLNKSRIAEAREARNLPTSNISLNGMKRGIVFYVNISIKNKLMTIRLIVRIKDEQFNNKLYSLRI